MRRHFARSERKRSVIEEHGEEKYENMLKILNDPSPLEATRRLVIPNFLNQAVRLNFSIPS
jgi:hypothetical protein